MPLPILLLRQLILPQSTEQLLELRQSADRMFYIPLLSVQYLQFGSQSALTSYLASAGISAAQISQDANARRAAALAAQQTTDAADEDDDDKENEPAKPKVTNKRKETKSQEAKRKKEEEKAIAKIKASKSFQRIRHRHAPDGESTDEDEAARAIFNTRMAPLPGQMDNCEVCEKRFSVTGYSVAGPNGGLLCGKCAKDLNKDQGPPKKKRKVATGRARRQIESNLLDGIYPGAKSLMTLCIETAAKNVTEVTDLGDLADSQVDRVAAILSKKWLLDSTTLGLFLRPGNDTVTVYDGSKLSSDDYISIFQIVPTVKYLRLRNAVQFKNKVMDHLLGTTVELESLSLHGANLIDDERWNRFMNEKSKHLKALKVYYTDGHFGDEQLELLPKACPQLECLKVVHNQKVGDDGLVHIAKLSKLKKLTLEIYNKTSTAPYVDIINSVGPGLRTLAIASAQEVDDSVLNTIHDNCQNLSKLRITDNEVLTDAGFASLFKDWLNPSLTYIDFHKCRHVDASEPSKNPDMVGLASAGFEAMMAHSGLTLRYLNVHSCRHISSKAFENVFALDKVYPALIELDVSFCHGVNDFVCGLIFRACPNLKKLVVFGNFGVRDVRVPKGKILTGAPNALGMQVQGMDDEDEGRVI
ncbi:related to nucleotide exsicion repair protein RAD7 [Rhynchosporium agropyri]|uniref:Related to nucleotide exsicion repair protein RAD7 n=1 Tax=Rhynchosporium agropyri TaxID=914238 RepID=A0A1E1LFB5_9HELO|nr:related to nucleotide exsicion repair protein RAD7 [Rhynchosporium agropyri]